MNNQHWPFSLRRDALEAGLSNKRKGGPGSEAAPSRKKSMLDAVLCDVSDTDSDEDD